MGYSIGTYITGWAMPDTPEDSENWLMGWQGQHGNDHQNIFNALNALEVAIGNPAYKLNIADLMFNPEELDGINEFMRENRFEHLQFYGWLNQLGASLPLIMSKPAITVLPSMNMSGPISEVSDDTWPVFMHQERVVHMLTLSAINQMYAAYGQ